LRIVINKCYGGFSLSPRAVKRLAELNGRECYFFVTGKNERGETDILRHEPISLEKLEEKPTLFFTAYDIPNPDEALPSQENWNSMTSEQRKASNESWDAHSLDFQYRVDRSDTGLIQVVEELGSGHRTGASGACANLKIVEIPDGVEYEIVEYDGLEHIAEQHRTWG
jgi:hypothetical protein